MTRRFRRQWRKRGQLQRVERLAMRRVFRRICSDSPLFHEAVRLHRRLLFRMAA